LVGHTFNFRNSKNKVHFFLNFASGRTLPTQSTGPQTQFFYRYLSIGRSNKKKFKKQSTFLFKFCFWEDSTHQVNWSLTHSTGPQTLFSQISQYRSLKSKEIKRKSWRKQTGIKRKAYFSKVYFPKVYFPKVYFPKVYLS